MMGYAFRHALSFALVALAWVACGGSTDNTRLLGYWEGSIPLPATGEQAPISYDFRPDGLTVTVGVGAEGVVSHWDRWEIDSEDGGDLIIRIYRIEDLADAGGPTQRTYATRARLLDGGAMMLWDPGTEESTAAHVRRVERPAQAPADQPAPTSPVTPPPSDGSGP